MGKLSVGKRWFAIAFAVIVVGAGVLVHLLDRRRDLEWRHGGDALTVGVEIRLVDGPALNDTVIALGAQPDRRVMLPPEFQVIVVRITWSDSPVEAGWFHLVALDARAIPPRPLHGGGGWHALGETGSNWAGAYEVLSVRYDWLAGTASTALTAAVDVPAARSGAATVYFHASDEARRLTGTGEVILGLFHVDTDGDVRWARRIHGQP